MNRKQSCKTCKYFNPYLVPKAGVGQCEWVLFNMPVSMIYLNLDPRGMRPDDGSACTVYKKLKRNSKNCWNEIKRNYRKKNKMSILPKFRYYE